ncbi:sarcosine oxidase subunit gamma [Devosia sp.]|uniref:sarcosine oxidase subunit gamma n=1 Tax=Devosia sp. TaxID=1871048 RepID=UPI002FC72A97
MAEFTLRATPALAGAAGGIFGPAAPAGGGISIRALPEGDVLQVLAAPDAGDLAPSLAAWAGHADFAVRPYGPGQWFVIAPSTSRGHAEQLDGILAGQAAVFDQGHGRVRIAIGGTAVADMLAKGTAVDLDVTAFPVGQSATTLLGHVSVQLTRVAPDGFELLVLRSFAQDVWDSLIAMGREYGVTAEAPAA